MLIRNSSGVLFREKENEQPANEDEETVLFNLARGDKNFEIAPINTNQPNDRLWMVIRNFKEKGYKIKKHDIIKLGRMKFRVKEFRTKHEYFNELDEKSPHEGFDEIKTITDHDAFNNNDQEEINPTCRFCWISDSTDDNPIIRSCNWSGSIKYIHFLCLKAWLASKVSMKGEETHTTLNWKQFECELWKMHYPYWFNFKGKRWNLVDLKRPEDDKTPYIILESLNSEKNSGRTIHTVVIKGDQKVFQLGRGHDLDLRINDISVSRRHASLEYREDGFYVVDFQSKFGTLVLLSHNITIPENVTQTYQIGRTIVTIRAKSKSKVPEFTTNNSHYAINNKAQKSNTDEYHFDNNDKDSESLKVVEIDGKRFLVRPEVEEEEYNQGRSYWAYSTIC